MSTTVNLNDAQIDGDDVRSVRTSEDDAVALRDDDGLSELVSEESGSLGDRSLSNRAARVDRRRVVQTTKRSYSRRWWVRGLALLASFPAGPGHQAEGHRWRQISPWLATALVVGGIALSMTGVGAPAGAVLLWTGVGIGAAGRLQAMADLTVQYQQDKELGRGPDGRAYAARMLGNALGLALVAVPVAGHFAHAIPGAVGHLLSHGQDALHAGVSAANVGLVATVQGGGVATNLAAGFEQLRRDHPARSAEAELAIRRLEPIEGELDVVDPVTGVQQRMSADAYVQSLQPAARSLTFAEPGPGDLESTWAGYLRAMREDRQFGVGFCGLAMQLALDRDDGALPPDQDNVVKEHQRRPGLLAVKQALWAATDIPGNDAASRRRLYATQLAALRTMVASEISAGREDPVYEAGLDRAVRCYVELEKRGLFNDVPEGDVSLDSELSHTDPVAAHDATGSGAVARDCYGAFTQSAQGHRSALVLDMSDPGNPAYYHAITRQQPVQEVAKDAFEQRELLHEQKLLSETIRRGINQVELATDETRKDWNREEGNRRQLDVSARHIGGPQESPLVTVGFGSGARAAAFLGVVNDLPAVLIDPPEGGLETSELLGEDDDWVARWKWNLQAIGTEVPGPGRASRRPDVGVQVYRRFVGAPEHLAPPPTGDATDFRASLTYRCLIEGYRFERTGDGRIDVVAPDGERRDADQLTDYDSLQDWFDWRRREDY